MVSSTSRVKTAASSVSIISSLLMAVFATRRSTFNACRLATIDSYAAGLSCSLSTRRLVNALLYAFCNASFARSKLRKWRIRDDKIFLPLRRWIVVRTAPGIITTLGQLEWPNLYGAIERTKSLGGSFARLVQITYIDQLITAKLFLCCRKRTIGGQYFFDTNADCCRGGDRLQFGAVDSKHKLHKFLPQC